MIPFNLFEPGKYVDLSDAQFTMNVVLFISLFEV